MMSHVVTCGLEKEKREYIAINDLGILLESFEKNFAVSTAKYARHEE